MNKANEDTCKVVFSFGVLQEYATTENNETFEVSKNWYWRFYSDTISIEAPLKSKRTIYITDSEDEPYTGNLQETISHVTAKIDSLKSLFEES